MLRRHVFRGLCEPHVWGLGANVFCGYLLEEPVLDGVAEWCSANALAVSDGGIDALLNVRADHLSLGVGEYKDGC
jgi:hypothetical protein